MIVHLDLLIIRARNATTTVNDHCLAWHKKPKYSGYVQQLLSIFM